MGAGLAQRFAAKPQIFRGKNGIRLWFLKRFGKHIFEIHELGDSGSGLPSTPKAAILINTTGTLANRIIAANVNGTYQWLTIN